MFMPKMATLAGAVLTAAAASAPLVSLAAESAGPLDRVAWLAGCWVPEAGEAGSGEQWMRPAGGTMLATARTVKAGKTAEFEFMRIHVATDGRLLFTALPSGQKETTFGELRSSATEIAFENAEHDFPQRVIYKLQGTRLLASIEGTRKGVARRIEFPMQRAKCEP